MIDAHLHLQMPEFEGIVGEIIEQAVDCGVKVFLTNGTAPGDWDRVAELARKYPQIIPSFGVHPWKVNNLQPEWKEKLITLLTEFPEAGIGEVGLDKWVRDHDIALQRSIFEAQLQLATEFGRPVSIHCLQAWGHLRKCLEQTPLQRPFLLHSFGGPREMMDDFLELGAYFSLSGYFLRPDKSPKRDAFLSIPEERILLETDAPDMLPPDPLIEFPMTRNGDPVNHPANLRNIYRAYADWRNEPVENVIRTMRSNFENFLGRPVRAHESPG